MPRGGFRPGSGRKSINYQHDVILWETQPLRWEQMSAVKDLDPLDVMRENMAFFHTRAAEILASLMALPLGQDANKEQLQGLKDFAGVVKCRELAQACARDLARYTHSPMAPKPADADAKNARDNKALEHIPTPKAVSDAFALAAAGLPPEPRKRL